MIETYASSRKPSPSRRFAFRLLLVIPLLAAAACVSHAQEPEPEKEPRRWTTEWSFEDIDLKDLAGKLRYVGLKLPVEVAGRAAVNFDVSVPVTALRKMKEYRFHGSLQIRDLIAADAKFEAFDAEVDFRDGFLKLERLSGTQGDGTFSGKATAMLDPSDKFQSELQLKRIDIQPIAKLLAKFGIGSKEKPIRGIADANITASGGISDLKKPDKWDIAGDLLASGIAVGESHQYDVRVNEFQLVDGKVVVPAYQVRATDLPDFFASGKANFRLDGTDIFDIEIAANDLPLTDILGMYFEAPKTVVDGKLDLQGRVQGSFVDGELIPQFTGRAAVASPKITVFGVELGMLEHDLLIDNRSLSLEPRSLQVPSAQGSREPWLVNRLSATYSATEAHFKLTDVTADLFGGRFQGVADIARLAAGNHSVKAAWQNVDPVVHWQPSGTSDDVVITGKTSGKVNWTAPADRLNQPSSHRGQAKISISDFAINRQPVGGFTVNANISEKAIRVDGDGKLFGGKARVRTIAPVETDTEWSDVTHRILGEVEVEDATIKRLLRFAEASTSRIDGEVSGLLRFRREPGVPFATTSEWTVRNLRVNQTTLSKKLGFALRSKSDALAISALRGTYAGGRVSGEGRWSLDGSGNRRFRLSLVRADGDRLLLPIDPSAKHWIGGKVNGQVALTSTDDRYFGFGSILIEGHVHVSNATPFGWPVGEADSRMTVKVRTKPLRWSADFRSLRSSLANGQVDGDLKVSSAPGHGFDMESRWRVNHVDFQSLMRSYLGSNTVGQGNVTGDVTLNGSRIQGADDLQGEFRLTLGGTDATAVPGLSTNGALLGAVSLAGVRFTDGNAKGRISKGQIQIEEMSLASNRTSVQASGRVTLANRSLDINAIAATGNFQGQTLVLNQLGLRDALNVLPVQRINQIVSDRTVVFDVVGPLRSPVVKVLTAETVRANTKRFLIREAAEAITAGALLGN